MDIPKVSVDVKVSTLTDKTVEIKPLSKKIVFKNATMYYHFNFDTNFILQNNHTLKVKFQDRRGNFNFILKDIILKKYPHKYLIKPMEHSAQIILNDPTLLTSKSVSFTKY